MVCRAFSVAWMSLHRKLSDRSVLAAMSLQSAAVRSAILQSWDALATPGYDASFDYVYCGNSVDPKSTSR